MACEPGEIAGAGHLLKSLGEEGRSEEEGLWVTLAYFTKFNSCRQHCDCRWGGGHEGRYICQNASDCIPKVNASILSLYRRPEISPEGRRQPVGGERDPRLKERFAVQVLNVKAKFLKATRRGA